MKFKNSRQRKAVMAKLRVPPPPPKWMAKEASQQMLTPKEAKQAQKWSEKHKSWIVPENKKLLILEAKAHELLYKINQYKKRKYEK